MATADSTRRTAGSSLSVQSNEFAGLSRRLLVAINQVALVSQHFGDLSGLSAEDAPAGMTLYQAAADLDRLYNDLDSWYVRQSFTSQSPPSSKDRQESQLVPPLPSVGVTDNTADRIRAFLASVRPLRGVMDSEGDDEYQRGRVIIERMAMSAKDEGDPSLALAPTHCADVLRFLSAIKPLQPQTWWEDPVDSPSHVVGFIFILRTLERSLRSKVF